MNDQVCVQRHHIHLILFKRLLKIVCISLLCHFILQDDFNWDTAFDDDGDDDIPLIKRKNKNEDKLKMNMFRLIDEDLTDED